MYKVLSIKYSFKTFFLSILTALYLLLNTIPAGAAPLSLSINPSIIEIKAIPPATAIGSLNIQNQGDTPVTLQIQLKAFKAKGENGELEYSKETLQIFKNIQILDAGVPVESLTLDPKQQKSLNLSITIPPDTTISARPPANSPAGEVGRDYYFSVLFISTNSSQINSNSAANQIGIATNVLLSVGSAEIPKAVIEEFSANLFLEKGPVPFTIRIKNLGAHFIKPRGEIIIKNMFGQKIGKLDLISTNVLADSIRAIPILWKENFLLGFYTATLSISTSDDVPAFTRSIHFFAFPFQALIIIVTIAIIIITINNRLKLYMKKDRT